MTELYDPVGLQYTTQQSGTPKIATDGTIYAPGVMQLTSSASSNGLPVAIPAIVQKTNAVSTGSVASLAKAFASSNTAGNSIVVVAGCGNGTAMTVADSAGNTYTSAIAAPNSTTFAAQIFYAVGIVGGANTVTVTNAGTTASMAFEVYEVSGLLTQVLAQPDQTTIGTGTGTTATGSAISATSPNSLAFMGVSIGTAAQNITALGSWNADAGTNGLVPTTPAGLFQFNSFSQYLSTITGVIPKATIASSEPYAVAAAIFKPVIIGVQGIVTLGGYNYTNITTATTTVIKSGPGILNVVVINKPGTSGTLTVYDNTAASGTKIASITVTSGYQYIYEVNFTTGLTVVSGGTAGDYTVTWR